MPISLRSKLLLTWSFATLLGATLLGATLPDARLPGVSLAEAGEPDQLQCANRYRNFLTLKYQTSEAKAYFEGKKGPAFWVKPFIPMRRVLVSKLRQLHRRPYPIMAFDDGSPIKANYLARSLYNRLENGETALNVDDIRKDLDFAMAYLKSYPADIAAFADAEATARLQRLALEEALYQIEHPKPGQGPGFPWLIELPLAKGESVDTEQVLFNAPTDIKVQIKLLDDRIKKLGGGLTEVGSFENRAYQQALNIKILETYRTELMRQMYKKPRPPVPPEAQKILDDINAIIGMGKDKMPAEYRPPSDAFHNIQWVQLRRELKEFSLTDAPDLNNSSILQGLRTDAGAVGAIKLPSDSLPGKKPELPINPSSAGDITPSGFDVGIGIGDPVGGTAPAAGGVTSTTAGTPQRNDFGKFVDAIKNLSDEQKEALGLNKLGAYTATFRRGKWVVGAASAYTMFTQGPKPWIEYLPQFWQNYIASDDMRRRLCAVKDEGTFADCVVTYIKEKHPVDYILQMEKGRQTLVVIDPKTKQPVMNKQIQSEFDELMKLRTEYKSYKAREMDFQAIVSGEMAKKDPTSDRWVQALVATPDKEQFKKGLIAYFEALYPLSFAPFKDQILTAVDAPAEKQNDLLNQIVADNFDIGTKLNDIMYKRANAALGYNMMGGYPIGPIPGTGTGTGSGTTPGSGGGTGGVIPLPVPGGGGNPGPLGSPYYFRNTGAESQPTDADIEMRKLEAKLRSKWLHQ